MRYLLALLILAASSGEAFARQGATAPPDPARTHDATTPSGELQLTPEEAVRLGLEHNLGLRAARSDAVGARAAARQVRADRLPAIRTRADYRRLLGEIPVAEFTFPGIDTTFSILPIPRDQVHTEISIEQPIFHGFGLRNRAIAARHEADAAELLADQEASDVAFAVRRAYWTLYQGLANRVTTEAALARVTTHLRDVESRVDEGVALRSDLLAARTRRSEVMLERVEADNSVRVARLELNRLIGLPLDSEIRPVPLIDTAPLAVELGVLTARAVEERPQLRALGEQVSALQRQVGISRGDWLPSVSLVGRYIRARPNPLVFADLDEFRGIGEAGVLLRWSLFEGGRRGARTDEARARLDAAEMRFDDARDQLRVEVARQYLEALRAEEALTVAAEHKEEADETFRVVSELFAEGVVLSAQVLEAEQVQRAAQARQAAAIAQHSIARAALLHALGQVW